MKCELSSRRSTFHRCHYRWLSSNGEEKRTKGRPEEGSTQQKYVSHWELTSVPDSCACPRSGDTHTCNQFWREKFTRKQMASRLCCPFPPPPWTSAWVGIGFFLGHAVKMSAIHQRQWADIIQPSKMTVCRTKSRAQSIERSKLHFSSCQLVSTGHQIGSSGFSSSFTTAVPACFSSPTFSVFFSSSSDTHFHGQVRWRKAVQTWTKSLQNPSASCLFKHPG